MRVRLHHSLATTSSSALSSSTTSSGVSGIGYFSGKVVKWVGLRLLDGYAFMEIRRRRWVIKRFVKQIEDVSKDERAEWLVKRERKVNRTMDDLLELSLYVCSQIYYLYITKIVILSSENYKPSYRKTARNHGSTVEELIRTSDNSLVSDKCYETINWMRLRAFPL